MDSTIALPSTSTNDPTSSSPTQTNNPNNINTPVNTNTSTTSTTTTGVPPSVPAPPPPLTDLEEIQLLDRDLWRRLFETEKRLAEQERQYIFSTTNNTVFGNIISGWEGLLEGKAPDKKKVSEQIFSGSSESWLAHRRKMEREAQEKEQQRNNMYMNNGGNNLNAGAYNPNMLDKRMQKKLAKKVKKQQESLLKRGSSLLDNEDDDNENTGMEGSGTSLLSLNPHTNHGGRNYRSIHNTMDNGGLNIDDDNTNDNTNDLNNLLQDDNDNQTNDLNDDEDINDGRKKKKFKGHK